MLFFTTGQISTEGWQLCRNAGIVAMDGEMVAAFLADKQVGVTSEGETSEFRLELFAQWLGIKVATLGNGETGDRLDFSVADEEVLR
jgi:hypothetical protein